MSTQSLGRKFTLTGTFDDQVKIAVNGHFDKDVYVDLVKENRLKIGAPHDYERRKSKKGDPRGWEHH